MYYYMMSNLTHNNENDYPYNYKLELVMPAQAGAVSSEITAPLNLQPLAKSRTDFKKCALTLQMIHIENTTPVSTSIDKVFYLVVDYNFTNSYKYTNGDSTYSKSKILGNIRCVGYTDSTDVNFIYKCLSNQAERIFFEDIPQYFNLTFRLTDFAGNTITTSTDDNFLTNSNVRILLNMDLY